MSQFISRMSLLSMLGYNSLLRSALDAYLLPLRRGIDSVRMGADPATPAEAFASALDLVGDSAEKAAMDLRNQYQSALLMQEEAVFWTRKIREALAP
jgi:hypothetical protein